MVNKENDKSLLLLLGEDSHYAFQVIYDRFKDNIYAVAIKMVKSPIIAQEIVQDVFMKLWFDRKNIYQINSLENWLFIVAKNHIINQLKKIANERRNLKNYQDDFNEPYVEVELGAVDKAVYVKLQKKALEQLTDHQRSVYELVRIHKLSYLEVAEKLNISPLTVKKHMSRAILQIRVFLKSNGFFIFF